MRLLALRLAEVGPFAAPVAVEGLGGGLDVLLAPNESGKSTLLAALKALFLYAHTSTRDEVRQLRPYAGGAPLIEAEFATAEGTWRLRKRFLANRSAELRRLDGGELIRGADAEARLGALVGGRPGPDQGLGLLWVGQREALSIDETALVADGAAFHALLASEITAAADGGRARAVRRAARAELESLVYWRGPSRFPKKGGRFEAAAQARDRLAREVAEARDGEVRARALLDEQGTLNERIARLADPDAAAARERARTAAAERLAAARDARAKLAEARALSGRAEAERQGAEQAAAAFAQALADGATIAGRRQAQDEALRQARERLAAALAAESQARDGEASAAALLAGARGRLQAREAADRRAALAAAAPRISVHYEAGTRRRVELDGRPLADGAVIAPQTPVELVIAGVGRIRIAPGHPAEPTAPLPPEVPAEDVRDLPPRAALATVESEAGEAHAAAIRTLEAARAAREAAALAVAAGEAAAAEIARRGEEIARLLPPAAEREQRAAALAAALGTARETANARLREVAAWSEAAPDADALARLATEAAAAEAAARRSEGALVEARNRLALVEVELRSERLDGAPARLREAEEALAAAERTLRRIEDDIAALALLEEVLAAESAASEARTIAPVGARLAPLVALALPDRSLALTAGAGVASLDRDGQTEAVARLSGGTREQIAVLVRLALARLYADRGLATPVILDDALVYADDERLDRMFEALAAAATAHQVLVLSCHARAFAPLLSRHRGRALAITPWTDSG